MDVAFCEVHHLVGLNLLVGGAHLQVIEPYQLEVLALVHIVDDWTRPIDIGCVERVSFGLIYNIEILLKFGCNPLEERRRTTTDKPALWVNGATHSSRQENRKRREMSGIAQILHIIEVREIPIGHVVGHFGECCVVMLLALEKYNGRCVEEDLESSAQPNGGVISWSNPKATGFDKHGVGDFRCWYDKFNPFVHQL